MDSKICLLLLGGLLVVASSVRSDPAGSSKKRTPADDRRDFVQQMIVQSWRAYSELAWGQESVHSAEPARHLSDPKTGETIFGALTTLWIADLRTEFAEAKHWIAQELNIRDSILADPVRRRHLYTYIGPLLSTYAITEDQFFLNKAIEFAQYDSNVNLEAEPVDIEDQIRHQLLEFEFLSDVTRNTSYAAKVHQFQTKLWEIEKSRTENYYLNGYPYDVEVRRSIQANGTYQPEALQKYRQVLDSALDSGLISQLDDDWIYYHNLPFFDEMLYQHCDLGASLTLGARLWASLDRAGSSSSSPLSDAVKERIARDENFAAGITRTCFQAAHSAASHLPPYKFTVNNQTKQIEYRYSRYELAPELAESYLALWRSTKDPKYRDQAWELTENIFRHARFHQGAYGSVKNVQHLPTELEDYQPLKALSGTLKYLFLVFSQDELLPTDGWVFNADGHPFPICGQVAVYPETVCKQQHGTTTTEQP